MMSTSFLTSVSMASLCTAMRLRTWWVVLLIWLAVRTRYTCEYPPERRWSQIDHSRQWIWHTLAKVALYLNGMLVYWDRLSWNKGSLGLSIGLIGLLLGHK